MPSTHAPTHRCSRSACPTPWKSLSPAIALVTGLLVGPVLGQTPNAARIAFVVGNLELNEGDRAMADLLSSLRFAEAPGQLDDAGVSAEVAVFDDDDMSLAAINADFDLLVSSPSVDVSAFSASGGVRCLDIPHVFSNPEFNFSDREGLTTAGGTTAGQIDPSSGEPLDTFLDLFVTNDAHPILHGFLEGRFVRVYDSDVRDTPDGRTVDGQIFSYASVGPNATIPGMAAPGARLLAESDFVEEAAIVVAEAGGLRADGGSVFLGRRVFLWLATNTADNLSEVGRLIVARSVAWALGGARLPCGANASDECSAFDCNANGVPDACDIAMRLNFDTDRNGVLDECELPPDAPRLVQIVGGLGPNLRTFISPVGEGVAFREFQIELSVDSGLNSATVDWTGDPADRPAVVQMSNDGVGLHTVVLDRALRPGHWARFALIVSSRTRASSEIVFWVAHLPDDVNQDSVVNVKDATAFGVLARGDREERLVDLNGDGSVDIMDASEFTSQWQGGWAGATLPPRP